MSCPRLPTFLFLSLALLLWPGCAVIKASNAAIALSKVSKASTAGKAASGVKVATGGKAALAAGVAAAVDDSWRFGRLATSADDLRFTNRSARSLDTAGSPALDAALTLSDFADWVQHSEEEPGQRWGEGAPSEVKAALQKVAGPGQAITACRKFGSCWMQGVKDDRGHAIAAYDPKTKRAVLLVPTLKSET